MDLTKHLDDFLYTSEINFNHLPKVVTDRIDVLLQDFSKHEILAALIRLKPICVERVNQFREQGNSSGHAGQMMMPEEMKQHYFPQLIVHKR